MSRPPLWLLVVSGLLLAAVAGAALLLIGRGFTA